MTENEKNLTIEIISEEVWKRIAHSLPVSSRIYHTARAKKSQWSLFRLHRFAFRRWAFLLIITVILITTMSWRLKSSHDLGDVIIIQVEKNDQIAIQQLDTINLLYRPENTDAMKLFFIGYAKPGANLLRTKLTSIGYSSTIPVRRISTESIFSRLYFKLFGKHIEHVDNSELGKYLNRSKHFVHLPSWKEPMGRTVIEAALCGCKIIFNENVGACSFDFDISDPANIDGSATEFWQKLKTLSGKKSVVYA